MDPQLMNWDSDLEHFIDRCCWLGPRNDIDISGPNTTVSLKT